MIKPLLLTLVLSTPIVVIADNYENINTNTHIAEYGDILPRFWPKVDEAYTCKGFMSHLEHISEYYSEGDYYYSSYSLTLELCNKLGGFVFVSAYEKYIDVANNMMLDAATTPIDLELIIQ